jgi:glycosyltransferase involved in cell wall biosynthesis
LNKEKILFLVAGRFGKTLIRSKILAILESKYFDKIYVFSENETLDLPKTHFINLDCLKKIKLRLLKKILVHFLEPLQVLFYAHKLRPQIINSFQLVPKAWYTVLICKLTRTKSIISSVGGISEIRTYLYPQIFWEKVNLICLKLADAITTKGQTVTNYIIKKKIPRNKIYTFNGAIDLNVFYHNSSIVKDIDILFVGQFIDSKGPNRVFEVIQKLYKDFPNISSVFLGKGKLFNFIQKKINESGLSKNIQLNGHIDDTAIFYQRSKVIIMPSKTEGLATSMLEAMACGCVPIVSNVGCTNEAAMHNFNALVVIDYNDIDKFYIEAYKILANSSLHFRLSKNAILFIKEKYSPEAQGLLYSKILEIL